MLQSTLVKILNQLPAIRGKLNVQSKLDEAWITKLGAEAGNIHVRIGEVHMGDEYRLTFNCTGDLLKVERVYWPPGDDLQYREVAI